MDCVEEQKQGDVMEVPEIDGKLLVELLDASLAAEEAGEHKQQLGFTADDAGDSWDSQELDWIQPHQEGCEDCGLDDILSGFEECGCSPAPYSPVRYWAEEMEDAAVGPFAGEGAGEWYMDGIMAME